MRIILDESAQQKLRLRIDARHTVVTTWFQGWSGLKNGALLNAAEQEGFELFITADQELSYRQNMTGRRIALLVLLREASFLSISDTRGDDGEAKTQCALPPRHV